MLRAGVRLRCPRCNAGPLYRRPFSMNSHCFHCGLKFEREQGYFVGAIYINYAATVAIAVPGFFLLDVFTNMTIHQQLALWVPFAVGFSAPVFPPFTKSLASAGSSIQPGQESLSGAAKKFR
jgi:uncharacterized protein (DUF983 family)